MITLKNNLLNIGIIIGGRSVEHDISILSGLQVYHAIDKEKYNVTIFYITKQQEWLTGKALTNLDTYKNENYKNCYQITLYREKNKVHYRSINKNKKGEIDIFIPVVHGEGIEDGTLSGYLDTLGATYTSADITSSSIAQDKIYTKELLQKENINVVPYIKINYDYYTKELIEIIEQNLTLPVIIKPARLGSSIGITVASTTEELRNKILESTKFSSRLLIEKKLTNFKEYNLAIIKEGSQIITSEIEEVIKTDDILSFKDKYQNNQKYEENTTRIIPADINEELKQNIIEMCKKAYISLNLKGVVRIDTIYDNDTNTLYLNEINTIPGSLSFYLFDKVGINFTKLIDILIKDAIISKNKEKKYLKIFTSNVLNNKTIKLKK